MEGGQGADETPEKTEKSGRDNDEDQDDNTVLDTTWAPGNEEMMMSSKEEGSGGIRQWRGGIFFIEAMLP